VYVVETQPDGYPQFVAIDGATGAVKFRWPLPRSTRIPSRERCGGDSARDDAPAIVGDPTVLVPWIVTSSDGRVQNHVTRIEGERVVDYTLPFFGEVGIGDDTAYTVTARWPNGRRLRSGVRQRSAMSSTHRQEVCPC